MISISAQPRVMSVLRNAHPVGWPLTKPAATAYPFAFFACLLLMSLAVSLAAAPLAFAFDLVCSAFAAQAGTSSSTIGAPSLLSPIVEE